MSTKKSKKSIRKELITFVSVSIVCIVFLLSSMSIYFTYNSTKEALVKSVKQTSKLASDKITKQIDSFSLIAQTVGLYKSMYLSNEDMKKYIKQTCSQYGLTEIDILSPGGYSLLSGIDYGKDDAFNQAKTSGNGFLTDPIIDNKTAYFEYAQPYDNSIVLMKIPYSVMGTIIENVKMGTTGSTYILNSKGTKVAHDDFSLVLSQQNNLEAVKKDPGLYAQVAALETDMIHGHSGFGFFTWKGAKEFGAYTPIDKTNGWSVNVTALESEFMGDVTVSTICMLALGVLALVLSLLATIKITNKITRPIDKVVGAIEKMSNGDLDIDLQVERQDEVGAISERINTMVGQFRNIIQDISTVLEKISQGNLTVQSSLEYAGEFGLIKTSMNTIISRLNDAMSQINMASEQVSSGAAQVSGGAQALSQGATEQASSIEELSATISEISQQVKSNAASSGNARTKVDNLSSQIQQSNAQMQNMIEAMNQISSTSSEIGKIIKTIEDIAFQTNILALNAAVEAARAGTAGKGFAVVADEVRNLASKSAQAAKNTTTLIESSIHAVENGTKIANETADALITVVSGANEITTLVGQISDATNEQASSINQITQGVDQVSAVVQTNSATAEESAAASEELSGQAGMLKELVDGFKLKDTNQAVDTLPNHDPVTDINSESSQSDKY